ncbi:MAG: DUF420 domain-containing protein [Candidatus Bathyarchaeia archaeon]
MTARLLDEPLERYLVGVNVGFFNPNASFLADVSLILQIAVLVFIFLAMRAKRKKDYKAHGWLMVVAVALHTVTILVVMLPSLQSMGGIFENVYNRFAAVTIIHFVVGGVAEILGLFLVGVWAFSRNTSDCFKKKQLMRVTIVLWLIGLVLGIYVYIMLYVPTLVY